MSKLSITYYFNLMGQPMYSGIKIHKSGKEAIREIINDSRYLFQLPVEFKQKPVIPTNGQFSIGFAFRQLVARFLTEEECAAYQKYGDKVHFDVDSRTITPPKDGDGQ